MRPRPPRDGPASAVAWLISQGRHLRDRDFAHLAAGRFPSDTVEWAQLIYGEIPSIVDWFTFVSDAVDAHGDSELARRVIRHPPELREDWRPLVEAIDSNLVVLEQLDARLHPTTP